MATAQRFTLTLAAILAVVPGISAATPEQDEFFEKQIRPILVEKCSVCHGEQLQTAGLDLTTAEGFYKGGESGPVFAKDAPHTSRLLAAVRYEGLVKMPPTENCQTARSKLSRVGSAGERRGPAQRWRLS